MRKGFTLIELMIVVAIIAVIAAIAIPNLVQSRIASNETAVVATMRTYLTAQNQFHRSDFYGAGLLQYASVVATEGTITPRGYVDLFMVGADGEEIRLIDRATANAWATLGDDASPRAGFLFEDLTSDAIDGDYDATIACGLEAMPETRGRSGNNQYVIDVTGTVYQQRLAADGDWLGEYPDVSGDGSTWIPVGIDG